MAIFTRHATLKWSGDVPRGAGAVRAGSAAFAVPATFPRVARDPSGATTPEELLAASHAAGFGIGLRSVLAARGGTAGRVHVTTTTVTAEQGAHGIRLRSSHLDATVEGLAGVAPDALPEIARAAEAGCTISAAIRGAIAITVEIRVTAIAATEVPAA